MGTGQMQGVSIRPRIVRSIRLFSVFAFLATMALLMPFQLRDTHAVSYSYKWTRTLFSRIDYHVPFPVFYINMENARERRHYMERDFEPLLGNLHRFTAIDARNTTLLKNLIGDKQLKEYVPDNVADLPDQGPSSFSELGCTLSHLLAIRQAYLQGFDLVLILEDDISPMLMPFWTRSITDLIAEANATNERWTILQLAWIYGQNQDIYRANDLTTGRRLFPMPFQWGIAAYIISRRGMEAIVATYFTNRKADGKVLLFPWVGRAEQYFSALSHFLVAIPSLFTVQGLDSTIMDGQGGESRNAFHRDSNRLHIEITNQLYYSREAHSSNAE